MISKKYMEIVSHYESCLSKYGDSHRGVDWPKAEDVDKRYHVMLDVIKPATVDKVSLLDFGCGASHLYEYMRRMNLENIEYSGLDISTKFITLCRQKYPNIKYYCLDILDQNLSIPSFDYIVMNGVFTEKRGLSFDEMLEYFQSVIETVFKKVRIGIAFNVMSKQVDWEREDLFHLPFDTLAVFLTCKISRHFLFRHDYGLYEYTVYAYRQE